MWKLVLIFSLLCSACYGAQLGPAVPDKRSFAEITRLMNLDKHAEMGAQQRYLATLRDKVLQAPVEKRSALLSTLSAQTKWGTYQRFIADYVCAWHGVKYQEARDYLLHATFWWEWKMNRDAAEPYSFQEEGIEYLYRLYERNHDYKLLHDIVTTRSDAAGETVIIGVTAEAITRHPRGVLHVAEISPRGYRLAWNLLHPASLDDIELAGDHDSLGAFRSYVVRVAKDPTDPLCALARELLRRPNR